MEATTQKKIAYGALAGLAIATIIILVRKSVKDKGYTKSKFFSKVFAVPYLETKFDASKYSDVQEQAENEQTTDGIKFRFAGTDANKPCGQGGTYCRNGQCIKGFCISK